MKHDADIILREVVFSRDRNGDLRPYVRGIVFNDEKIRFNDGDPIYTSQIEFIKTKNTTYRLVYPKPEKKEE